MLGPWCMILFKKSMSFVIEEMTAGVDDLALKV